ncbi:MAG: hypothetical protein CFE31_00385 [Rhizobiales bacterium PAR1]|nr:MAG: hypothetical protein CFE31_00385 [Rhizobiales bacterium PAR1]
MFEIGKRYQFNMVSYDPTGPGGTQTFNAIISEVHLPLIKIQKMDGPEIINTQSSYFISAELSKYQ